MNHETTKTKQCVHCAEKIPEDAVVCVHCKRRQEQIVVGSVERPFIEGEVLVI